MNGEFTQRISKYRNPIKHWFGPVNCNPIWRYSFQRWKQKKKQKKSLISIQLNEFTYFLRQNFHYRNYLTRKCMMWCAHACRFRCNFKWMNLHQFVLTFFVFFDNLKSIWIHWIETLLCDKQAMTPSRIHIFLPDARYIYAK